MATRLSKTGHPSKLSARGSVPVNVHLEGKHRGAGKKLWQLAEEVPVNLAYNGRPHVVMMATPADLEDFARGFSLSEGVLPTLDLIKDITIKAVDGGIIIDVITGARKDVVKARQARSMEGRTGCGLCGLQTLDQVIRNVSRVHPTFELSASAVARAFEALPERQSMNKLNHSVHAAAWCDPSGNILMVREDVGRHNALDKLIGALADAKVDGGGGFIVMTSRCSFELVQKTAIFGSPYLATVSAPTSLALDLAEQAGMRLASLSVDGVVMFDSIETVASAHDDK